MNVITEYIVLLLKTKGCFKNEDNTIKLSVQMWREREKNFSATESLRD